MATSNFLVFDQNKQNMIDHSVYQSSNYRINGVTPGIAPSAMHNKMFYQWSMMVTAFGQFVANQGFDASDADLALLTNNITQALLSLAGSSVLFWQPNTKYTVSDIVYSKNLGMAKWFYCTQGGISGAAEPTWAANEGITTDNTVRWVTHAGGSALVSGGVPPAGVALPFRGSFGGTGNKYPIDRLSGKINTSWHICDGTDGTQDLRGRFILVASSAYPAGTSGGAAAVTLSIDQIPSHSHGSQYYSHSSDGIHEGRELGQAGAGVGPEYWTYPTTETGDGQPHTNMPPFYSLAYIEQIA
ncbi:hypothetical protein [Sporomusa sp. KB1]|uniref:hypothetical protein n=1 Tax=Sporomusa sp. KB1 TaxID=943346 RepID=UPI00119CB50D|nr:hypothetical protein [Sporomusa sp. KB1]TWH46321.1 hypothetical protein Salpa_2301 [Sporomusa sp. KB1]